MTRDIQNDDYLVVEPKEYPIRSAAFYPYGQVFPSALMNDAYIACSTKRKAKQTTAGKRESEPATQERDLLCTPLYPADARTMERRGLKTPSVALVTYVPCDDGFYELIIEELKR